MRRVRSIGEAGLIERVKRQLGRVPRVRVGIGDDAAVLRGPGGQWLVFASDMLVEGVHFRIPRVAPERIGWKALASNISDVAAMGGSPHWAVVSLGLPGDTPVRFVDALYRGLRRCARRFGVAIVGGDTVRAPQVVIDVAILGTVQPEHLVLRSSARANDVLVVTGRLGGSLESGRHAAFLPRLREARVLVQRAGVHAMMDLSDGLASDLWRMSRSSRMRLRVVESQIPVTRSAGACTLQACPCRAWGGRPAAYHALMDGEDFELLCAVSRRAARALPARIGACPVTRIGEVIGRGIGVELRRADGRIAPLRHTGFCHF